MLSQIMSALHPREGERGDEVSVATGGCPSYFAKLAVVPCPAPPRSAVGGGAPFPVRGGIVSSLQLSVNLAWHRAAQWQEVGPGFEPSVCWSLSPYHPSPCTHSSRLAGWSLSVSFSSLRTALSLGLRIRNVCPVAPRSKVGPAASLQVLCGAHHRSHIRT